MAVDGAGAVDGEVVSLLDDAVGLLELSLEGLDGPVDELAGDELDGGGIAPASWAPVGIPPAVRSAASKTWAFSTFALSAKSCWEMMGPSRQNSLPRASAHSISIERRRFRSERRAYLARRSSRGEDAESVVTSRNSSLAGLPAQFMFHLYL